MDSLKIPELNENFPSESHKVNVVALSLDWGCLHTVPFLCEAVRASQRIFLTFSAGINTKFQVNYFSITLFCLFLTSETNNNIHARVPHGHSVPDYTHKPKPTVST